MENIFKQIGEDAAVDAAVTIFYRKILKDNRIKHFFTDIDMKIQIGKQKAFLTMLFGGPNQYTGKDLRSGHAHLVKRGLNDEHFNAVVEHLSTTLSELKVPERIIEQIIGTASAARGDVLGRT
ncbi:group I truncated hemoglobin [Fluviispira multicolorata]|uniref:Group 1 truncated hemoglobin n=1 Tax=Fluviispira multicolorata TaxID=2654512 RepID=A0A833JHA1_9BACT|nr:group 1 truncated hemoglobin [Fluviispira multicolorata]KAB8033287.1 group 1 truncated hemoglobin [Fluviispira multicolorata]